MLVNALAFSCLIQDFLSKDTQQTLNAIEKLLSSYPGLEFHLFSRCFQLFVASPELLLFARGIGQRSIAPGGIGQWGGHGQGARGGQQDSAIDVLRPANTTSDGSCPERCHDCVTAVASYLMTTMSKAR